MAFGRRLVAAMVCAALLVVGGCADDPEPTMTPPDETPTSTSPSPSATATPEPWEKKTNAGAVAFAKHWIDVFNEAQRTGDTSVMRELSAKSCGSCRRFAGTLDDLYSGGGRLESKGWRVLQVSSPQRASKQEATVALRLEQSPQTVHSSDGEVEEYPGGQVTYSAELGWVAASWVMTEMVLLE